MLNEIKQNLINLGLNANEAEVYLFLLENGASSTGPVIEKTRLHRNVVYTALSHLIKMKLVAQRSVRGVKRFTAISPVNLREEFEQKTILAEKVIKDISEKLPAQIQEITVHQGNEEYLNLLSGLLRSMPRGSTKYVIGTGGEDFMSETMRPIWKRYHKIAHAQKIKIKMISYASQRPAIEEDVKREGIYEVKYLPEAIENPSGVHVYPEAGTVLNIIYSDKQNPVTAIKIKNQTLVKGYLNLFNNMWGAAKE